MKQKLKTISLALTMALALGSAASALAACGGKKPEPEQGAGETTGTFSYDTEMLSAAADVSNGYNGNLFYVNTLEFQVADPSVIYISEGEDAGWFYAYGTSDDINCHGIQAWRSKDLSHWECTGIAFQPDYSQAWAVDNYWAPEVIYDASVKLYYMFYNAFNVFDNQNLWLSVAVSESPSGPFESPDGVRDANGTVLSQSKPVFDLTANNPAVVAAAEAYAAKNPDAVFNFIRTNALDASPFVDPVTNEKYLFFSYYISYTEGSFIYGMKMKDWFTPDYGTLTCLAFPNYATVELGIEKMSAGRLSEGGVNEGPFMVYHDGSYYLTYSAYGYEDANYQVKQAIADSPLGAFEKISPDDGGKVVSTDVANWTHIVSAGHHSFIRMGDETFIAYHTFKDRNSIKGGRALAVDKVVWTTNSDGTDVMHTNGPSWSVQPLPEAISGYKNIAPSATVTADKTAPDSDVALLTDGLLKYQEFDLAEEYTATQGTSTITLSWDGWRSVRAIMLYNSYDYEQTFVQIDRMDIEYLQANGEAATVTLTDVPFDWSWNCEMDYRFMRPGGACIAEFYEMPVRKITVTLQSAADSDAVSIGEIVVLGKDTACEGVSAFEPYRYTNQEVGSAFITVESETFGTIPGTSLATMWGYDVSHDDGTDDAYILQNGPSDQYAYFKDIYSTAFYVEAYFTVTADASFPLGSAAHDPYPKFGIVMSCDDSYNNTLFYYVDAVGYANQSLGCAQRTLDNTAWDWSATEQNYGVSGISYTGGDYVKLAVLRQGKDFYFLCEDRLVATYSTFNIFDGSQKAGVGFLSFNTPMKIKDYYATADEAEIADLAAKFANSVNGETFGGAGSFSTTSGWDLTNDRGEAPTAVNTGSGDQYAFFKNVYANSFTVETEITVTKDFGDAYPKFGIAACSGGNTFFFYIDGSSKYTAQRLGWVQRNAAGDDWGWSTAGYNEEKPVNIGSYTDGNYVKLKMVREGATFLLYANDELIFTVSGVNGFGENDACAVSILSFNTGVTVRNYSAQKAAQTSAASLGMRAETALPEKDAALPFVRRDLTEEERNRG